MKVVVTGANGYLGQGIVKELCDFGVNVIAVDSQTDTVDARAHKVNCDLFKIHNAYNYLGCPEILLHLAWRDGFIHQSENHIIDLPKHYKFLKSIAESKTTKIVVMGTMHEIGYFEGCINERTPCNPQSLYGISKDTLRRLTMQLCLSNSIGFQWLRAFYIVGNSKVGNSIFSKLAAAEERGDEEFPFTLGQNQYDFINYNEFCVQVASAITQNDVIGIINICSGLPEKLSDRVERFIEENRFSIRLKYGAYPDRPYDSKAIWGDNTKIKQIMRNHKGHINA